MTETTHPEPAPSPHVGVSSNATVVAAAEARRGEWGSRILPTLVRNFTRAALRKPTVADYVGEHIFDIATSDDEPPAAVGDALRLALYEVLATTTSEDWAQVASDLLAYARECIEDKDSAAAPLAGGWAPPPSAVRWPRTRKQPVRVELSETLAWLTERGSATTREIAQHFNISKETAWRNTNLLVAQGQADVTPGELHRPRVYSIPRAIDAPADSLGPQPAITTHPKGATDVGD